MSEFIFQASPVTIASYLEPLPSDMTDQTLPPHLVLAADMSIGRTVSTLSDELADLARSVPPLEVKIGGVARINDQDVRLVENTPHLQALHEQIVGLSRLYRGYFVNETYTGDKYVPHIRNMSLDTYQPGDEIELTAIDVIRTTPSAVYKELLGHYAFEGCRKLA